MYLQPYVAKYPNLSSVQQTIIANIPLTIPPAERIAFTNDVNNAWTVVSAMELLLRFLGKSTLERIFP